MATDHTQIVKKAVQGALEEIKDIDPEGWTKLQKNSQELQQVTQAATKAAEEEVNLHTTACELIDKFDRHPPEELGRFVSETLAKHLPSSRIDMIAKGLQIPTYRLNFRHENNTFFADITKGGDKFMDSIRLATVEDVSFASGLQIASIVVEAVLLVLSVVGISVPEEAVAKVARQLANTIMESRAVKAAVEVLRKVWSSGGSSGSKATAIWDLIKALWEYKTHGKILWQIMKGLCSNMSWVDWLKTAAIISATIIAALASGGAALVAKIALAVNSAYEFGKKISNLQELDEIKKTL